MDAGEAIVHHIEAVGDREGALETVQRELEEVKRIVGIMFKELPEEKQAMLLTTFGYEVVHESPEAPR